MGMDIDEGRMRELMSEADLREKEVLFRTGEVVKIKGGYFKIEDISTYRLVLVTIPKEQGMLAEISQAREHLTKKNQ